MANTYFNPNSIQNFADPANNGKFLKKNNSDIIFANPASRMKFVNFTGSTWDFNNSDDNTFTYGSINTDTVISVLRPTSSDKREILHILRIDNNDSVPHTITFQSNSNSNCELLSPYQFKVYANSSIEFIATAFMDSDDGSSPVNPKTQVSIYAVYGYEPYNAVVNPMQFLVMDDLPQSNWNETNPLSKAYIQNKPNIVSSILFNGTPATVSDGIATITAAIPDAQIQSDWAQTDDTAADYIKHKPDSLRDFVNDLPRTTISVTPNSDNTQVTIVIDYHDGTTPSTTTIPLSGGSGSLTQLPSNWNETNPSSVQYIQNKPTLATVATSGNYNDLSNKPTIPAAQVQSDWDATSGMGEILNKPTNVSAFTNDAGYITAHQSIDSIISSTSAQTPPTIIAQSLAGGDTVTLHKVAWTGTYDDLLNKPTIPVVPVNVSAFNNDAGYITSAPAQVQSNWNETNPASAAYIENKPSLFSGSYNDLTDKPTIPAAQVNSDWDAVSGVAQILNKPTIPAEQINSDWNVSDPASKAYILNKPDVPEDSVDYLRFEFSGTVQARNFSLKKVGNPSLLSLEYKLVSYTDGSIIKDWTIWTPDSDGNRRIFDLGANGPVIIYLRGDNYDTNLNVFSNSNYYQFYFKATDSCYCHGNLLTIYKKDGKVTSVPQGYRFYKLFASTSNNKCNIQSAPYVKLQSASSSCFNEIFSGNTYGLTIKDIKFDIVKGSENYVYERHQLNTAINPANGEIYVEKPAVSSYVTTLTYNDSTINWSSLTADYNAGKHIRCKETVNGETFYADLFSYEVVGTQMGDMPTFTFKYVESETDRNCIVYKCQYLQNTVAWLKTTESLDEIPLPSTYGQFLTYDSTNGLTWEDILPDQSGQSGKFLTTDGSVLSWGTPSGGGGGSTGTLNTTWNTSQAASISTSESLGGVVNLHKISKTGSYNDLLDTPTIPAAQVNSDWNATSGVAQILHKPDLAPVATSGDYDDLTNKPNIPTVPVNISAFNNDVGYITSAQIPSQVNADWNATSGVAQILNKPTLATVATSGSYNDLSNKPTIPDAPVNADWNAVSGLAMILNKPTIPTVPTNVSAFTNDAGYLTSETQANWNETNTSSAAYIQNKPTIPAAQVNSDWNATSGVAEILNKPDIPANVLPTIYTHSVTSSNESGIQYTVGSRPTNFYIEFTVVPNITPWPVVWHKGSGVEFLEGVENKLIINNKTTSQISITFTNPWNSENYWIDIPSKKYAVLSMWFYTISNEEKVLFIEYNYNTTFNTYGATNISML